MTDKYIKDRDEACSEKTVEYAFAGNTGEYREYFEVGFEDGSDWATARAEERAKGFLDLLRECHNQYGMPIGLNDRIEQALKQYETDGL